LYRVGDYDAAVEAIKKAAIYNLASQIVIWGLLVTTMVVVISGYLLPWSRGAAIDIFGLVQIPAPIPANHDFHELSEELHEFSGLLVVPLFLLHLLGAFLDTTQIMGDKHIFLEFY
jgi:cytochrome b561